MVNVLGEREMSEIRWNWSSVSHPTSVTGARALKVALLILAKLNDDMLLVTEVK